MSPDRLRRFRSPRAAALAAPATAGTLPSNATDREPGAHEVPEEMRAVVFDAPGPAESLRETAAPTPAPVLSELLVRVVAAGVNPLEASIVRQAASASSRRSSSSRHCPRNHCAEKM